MAESPDIGTERRSLFPPVDIPGFVFGARFRSDGTTRVFGPLDRGFLDDSGGFVWLHLSLSDARVPAFLASIPGTSEVMVQMLTGRDPHVVIDAQEGLLLGTIPDLQRTFEGNTRDFGWLRFVVTDRLVVTTRVKPLRSVDRVRSLIDTPGRIRAPLDVVEALLVEFQRTLNRTVAEITEEMNLIEDFVFDDVPRDERRRLGPPRRLAAQLHRHLRALLSALRHVESEEDDVVSPPLRALAERVADRLERTDRDVLALQERARLLHDEIDSKISSETNRHLYIVSVMTAFLLPPTLVAGIFGMNTGGMPWLESPHGTLYALGFCALSLVFAWWLLRRAGIL